MPRSGTLGALEELLMETFAHLELKRLAVAWLARLGCRAIATEVACPLGRYRVDVAGWLDHAEGEVLDAGGTRRGVAAHLFSGERRPEKTGPKQPRTIVIECKQSRSDFIRDDRNAESLRRRLDSLTRTRERIERELIPQHEPHLRESGSSLFQELETWDYAASSMAAYRKILRDIRRTQKTLYGETKFCMMERYRLADHFFLFTPTGLLKRHDLPEGWGHIEVGRRRLKRGIGPVHELADLPVQERVSRPSAQSPERRRRRFLRNIAVAASRSVLAQACSAGTIPHRPR